LHKYYVQKKCKPFVVNYQGESSPWFVVPLIDPATGKYTGDFAISAPSGETYETFKQFKKDLTKYFESVVANTK